MYLPFRHDQVARFIYYEILRTQDPETKFMPPEPICKAGDLEIWWDLKIPCTPKVPFNRPDIIVWNKTKRISYIIEIGIPLDANVGEVEITKQSKYIPLAVNLKRAYPEYSFECVPIVIGSLGLVSKNLPENLKSLGFEKPKAQKIIKKLIEKVVRGTVKIAKSALTIKN